MNWRQYTLLSYSETHNFSQRRSIVGIVLIVVVCLVAGIISLLVSGKLKTCMASFQPVFQKAQVKEGGEGCKGTTVSVGEVVNKNSFTYVVANQLDYYRDETLQCQISSRSATINVMSFAAPQFVWGYQIICSRPDTCCPKKTVNPTTTCFCDKKLMLHIQDFSGDSEGSQLLNSAATNYSLLNGTVSSITVQTCPNEERITVLRFTDKSYYAFSSSAVCYGKGGSNFTFEDDSISFAINQIRNSIDTSIDNDLENFKVVGHNYECYSCSHTHNLGQLLLNLLIAISAIGSITYSIVIWLLKVTQQEKPSNIILEMPIN